MCLIWGNKMNSKLAWKIMLLWFTLVMIILSIAGEWGVVAFGLTYGIIFGGFAYRYRRKVMPFFQKIKLDNYLGFLLLAVVITITEEIYCYALGNRIAHPVLWIDLILVTVMWTVWFGTWYFFLSKKYMFTEKEALMVAGFTGIFYEFIGTGAILTNPFGFLIATPLAVVIYAAIFVLPMQLITFNGKNNSKTKYLVGSILPFILTIPVAIALYLIFSIFNVAMSP